MSSTPTAKADGTVLTGVSETALLTLQVRASEARRPDSIIDDPMAILLADSIDYDFAKFGFARRQDSYERAFGKLFESLQWLEDLLGERRYLLGERLCEADWRLFPTLVRFDEVYHVHFRCNHRRIVEYPNLWGYARELYQWPGVAQTVAMEQIKRHYYTTHDELNPKRIIPVGPAPDWSEPHGRG